MFLSESEFEKAKCVIPGGVNSPVRSFPNLPVSPIVVERGEGDVLIDLDSNRYIDFCMSWGALILGHAPKAVLDRVDLSKGTTFGTTTAIERQIAEKIIEIVPSIEKVRFVSSGTESVMSAVRLARGFTKRKKILKFIGCYHGHSDQFMVKAGSYMMNSEASSAGVVGGAVQDTITLPFNEIGDFFETYPHLDDLAAVVVEPVAGNMGVVPPKEGFLETLREKTRECNALLIFDEVITGFRVGLQGAQGLYDVEPDLTCLGKIVGGGFPAAAFGGSKEIMDYLAPEGPVFQAGTLSGNPIAMQAGLATLETISKPGFYEALEEKTKSFLAPIREVLDDGCVQSVGSMFTIFLGPKSVEGVVELDQERFAAFFAAMFEQGVYIPPSPYEAWFISSAHSSNHLNQVQEIIIDHLK